MPLDLLDDEFIWNLAKIIRVSSVGDTYKVTVRYEGWGSEWDIELPYPNERLARVFSHTRQVRCFAILLGSSKVVTDDKVNIPGDISSKDINNWTNVWPCKVSFRMPHHDKQSACDALRMVDKVFVQPYMTYALPRSVRRNMIEGGQWVETSQLLPWKDLDVSNPIPIFETIYIIQEVRAGGGPPAGNDPTFVSSQDSRSYSVVMKEFCVAYQTALSDWVQGRLPPQALSEGVLLNDAYRIHPSSVDADPTGECRYSGSLAPRKMGLHAIRRGDTNRSHDPPLYPDATKVAFASLPLLPSPISIIQRAYSNTCIRHLEASNRWAGVLRVAGNEIFVGAYASQVEARHAVQLASAQLRKENCQGGAVGVLTNRQDAGGTEPKEAMRCTVPCSGCDSLFVPNAAHTSDLFDTTAESVVSAFEESQLSIGSKEKPVLEPTFHLHEWIGQHYRHVWHGKQHALPSEGKCDVNIRTAQRKQKNPKRLQQNLYLRSMGRGNSQP
jgi:hypothetical protein